MAIWSCECQSLFVWLWSLCVCVCVHVRGVGVWLSLGIPLRDGSEVVNLDLGDIIGVTCLVRGRRGC